MGIDWLHLAIFGTKFTYILNPASPTAFFDLFFYLFIFAGLAFLVGFIFTFEAKDVVVAGFIGPFLFLLVNYFIIIALLHQNPAYGSSLVHHWQWYWGVYPDWLKILPEVQTVFTILYSDGIFFFLLLASPFILAASFTGYAAREMMRWKLPR
ncbi:MAG: hypothetical protein ACFFBR_03215 [Promethearchaeota archaeon]